jgi:hypothetical protein
LYGTTAWRGRVLQLSTTCEPDVLRDAITALGSNGGGANLRELRLHLRVRAGEGEAVPGGVMMKMLPGCLPQLRRLKFTGCEVACKEALPCLLLAPGPFLEKLDVSGPGVVADTFGAIADEVRLGSVTPA